MGKLQLLCATMEQTDFSKVYQMRITSDVIFANQSDRFAYIEETFGGNRARMYTTATRGVGLNRNLALLMADGEICLIADDDVVYSDGYQDRVLQAFDELKDADMIVFGLLVLHDGSRNSPVIRKIKKMGPFSKNPYGGPCIAFRLDSIRKANIWFTMLFGGGSRYDCGEDSFFIRQCVRKGLTVYAHPYVVGQTDTRDSTWFKGLTKTYFFSKGAYFRMAHPKTLWLWMLYCAFRAKPNSRLSKRDAIKWMRKGSRCYQSGLSYSDWEAQNDSTK